MTNRAAIDIIARALPELQHPGSETAAPFFIPLPMFRNANLPAEQAKAFAKQAGVPDDLASVDMVQLVAQALAHALEQGGQPPTAATTIAELQTAAAANDERRHRQVTFRCYCGAKLFTAAVKDFATDTAEISPNVIKAVQAMSAECALSHGVGA